MIRQTRNSWNIHHQQYHYAQSTINNWALEWQEHEQQLTKILKPNTTANNNKTNALISIHLNKYIHGHDPTHMNLKKILELRNKYGQIPDLQKLEPEEYETAAQIMLHNPPNTNTRKNKKQTNETSAKPVNKNLPPRKTRKITKKDQQYATQHQQTNHKNYLYYAQMTTAANY